MDVLTGIAYIVRSIFALAAIILLANFILKKLQDYSTNQNQSIEILERVSVTKASALALVKVGGQIYLMSLTENDSEILRELSTEEVAVIEKQQVERKEKNEEASTLLESLKNFQDKYQEMFSNKKK